MPNGMQGALERYEERQREEKKAAKVALLALVDQLRTAGVSEVIATFSGYGDEGSTEKDVIRFIRDSPAAYDLRKVSQSWFLDLALPQCGRAL